MHQLRTTVWCGFWEGGVIGPFFFEIDEGNAVFVNEKWYRDMLFTQLWANLKDVEI